MCAKENLLLSFLNFVLINGIIIFQRILVYPHALVAKTFHLYSYNVSGNLVSLLLLLTDVVQLEGFFSFDSWNSTLIVSPFLSFYPHIFFNLYIL